MIKLKSTVVYQVISGETVLLDVARGTYFDLNASATVMVQALLNGGDRNAAVAAVLELFDADAERVDQDLDRLLRELTDAELIESI